MATWPTVTGTIYWTNVTTTTDTNYAWLPTYTNYPFGVYYHTPERLAEIREARFREKIERTLIDDSAPDMDA